tara:strand:+ start:345 stop:785 length:441 start_codon:yes stop_codon:yes gene_type:complete
VYNTGGGGVSVVVNGDVTLSDCQFAKNKPVNAVTQDIGVAADSVLYLKGATCALDGLGALLRASVYLDVDCPSEPVALHSQPLQEIEKRSRESFDEVVGTTASTGGLVIRNLGISSNSTIIANSDFSTSDTFHFGEGSVVGTAVTV